MALSWKRKEGGGDEGGDFVNWIVLSFKKKSCPHHEQGHLRMVSPEFQSQPPAKQKFGSMLFSLFR